MGLAAIANIHGPTLKLKSYGFETLYPQTFQSHEFCRLDILSLVFPWMRQTRKTTLFILATGIPETQIQLPILQTCAELKILLTN